MPFAILLGLASVAGATALTYLYDRGASIFARLCAGVCLGFALLGLAGFVCASLIGMTAAALILTGVVVASPLLLFLRGGLRARFGDDLREGGRAFSRFVERPGKAGAAAFTLYAAAAVLFWLVYGAAMYQDGGGVFTGVDTNIGDLPFHIAVITGFAYGDNFPPEHPEFAGVRLTYPFVVDFVTALFVRAGATLQGAMFWQNFAMIMSLVGLLHRWALKLTRDRVAALITCALVLLSGGFGWYVFLGEAASGGRGFFGLLGALPHDYTVMGHLGYHWGNAVTVLFVPQRSILLGVSLALVVWTLWWDAAGSSPAVREGLNAKAKDVGEEGARRAWKVGSRGVGKKAAGRGKKARVRAAQGREAEDSSESSFASCLSPFALRPMSAAGAAAGLMPLAHAHSFVVMMLMGGCVALAQGAAALVLKEDAGGEGRRGPDLRRLWAVWRPWLVFAGVASLLAVPQMLWATSDSAVRAGQFFGREFGWVSGDENVLWFWIKNTAFFIPLLVAALAWRGRAPVVPGKLLFFFLPFVLCFVVPNVYKLSPWVWDNIKVLLYWWMASAPLVALALARLWRWGAAWRAAAAALLLMQTGAGALDVWRAATGAVERRTFDPGGVAFAEVVRGVTPPRSLILHAPTYNDPVYMTGRRTFLGYPGHVWSHGMDYRAREAELKTIYAGGASASRLIEKNGIEYVVVGPLEREEMRKVGVTVNEAFFNKFEKVGQAGEYRLFKTRP